MSSLTIRLFGAPEIELSGRLLETDRRKAVALLAYLAVTGAAHSRDALAAMFWPDFDTSRGYAYLRRTLWELGQALGEGPPASGGGAPNGGWVLAERDLLRLDPKADWWVDVNQFQELVKKGRGRDAAAYLSEAAALYRGDFMAGFSLRDSPDFDAWQVGQSESLRGQLSEVLAALSRACAAQGETDAAVAHARRWLALDNLNEAAHRLLMELYTQAGQRSAAVHQYETCARLLLAELNVQPEPATQSLYESIRRGQFSAAPSAAAVAEPAAAAVGPSGAAAPAVLAPPRPGTPFVGREKELAEITRLLADPDCRMLTLVGPGGAGKTRLALQIAGSLGASFAGGVTFVPLAPVAAPELVVRVVAAALHFKFKEMTNVINERETLQSPSEQLLDYLREKELLLVLDNFEHLIPAAGLVSDILAAAPGVKVLATSRERLNLAEEWALAVAGMAFPDEELAAFGQEYGAVRLFVQVARQAQVGFEPADADWRAMTRICRLVDGMPLAIEMAASWVRVLSVSEIAAEIERSLDFLTTARPGTPERHRNLRAVFEHSWMLLSESERAAFRKLSIFHGGFTREAAAQVAGASLSLLLALVDKSLVRRNPDGRFDLHEVLKRYAAEKLDEAPQQNTETQEAYHHYYLAMLQDLADALKGPAQQEALDRLDLDYDNLRASWLLTAEIGDLAELEQGLMALSVIHDFGQHYRQVGELLGPVVARLRLIQPESQGLPLFTSSLALSLSLLVLYHHRSLENGALAQAAYLELIDLLPGLEPGLGRAYVLKNIDFGAYTMPLDQVERNYQECSQIFKDAGDAWGVTSAILTYNSTEQLEQGRLEQVRSLGEQALASSQAIGSRWGMALSYHFLALAAFWASEYDKGLDYGQLAHDLYLEFKDRWRAMEAQVQIGRIETDLGRYDAACRHFQENLQFAEEMGARYFVALNQDCLGYVELLRGNLDLAAQYYRDSLKVYRQLQNIHGQGMSLGNLGDVAMQQGDHAAARQYYVESLEDLLKVQEALWGQSVTYKKLGRLELLSGNYAEAGRNLERALAISTEIRRESDIQEVLVLLAELKFKTGALAEGRALLEQVLASSAATPPVRANAQELLGRD